MRVLVYGMIYSSIVMEYANGGDLYQKILEHQRKGCYMSEQFLWNLFIQITKGLKALHELNILHRDLKSANVFLNSDGTVKLGDMNVSKVAKNGFLYTQTGTPYYASPEVWKDKPYNVKSDIWSLGCVLYEAITLKPPFRAEDMQGLFRKVVKGEYNRIPRTFSNELSNLVNSLLIVDFKRRPSCGELYLR
jgi:NIMA (never in mitosis gene a)-related kinase